MGTNNAINLNSTGITGYDGAGTFNGSTLTQHSLLLGGANNHTISNLGVATNGQLPIGSTGADPVLATLTPGTGISIANTAGAITINGVGSGLTWSVITASQNAAINNGYICNKAGVLILTMPGTAAVGSVIAAVNINTAADTQFLSANPGQLNVGNVAATANTGTVTSTQLFDVIYFVCTTANTTWCAFAVQGNWTIA
jgi:hypothetical protein